jgi:hypothetical protein
MIQGIIFSKDRALQLDATLNSLFRHCKNADHVNLSILYKTTNHVLFDQYCELQKAYSNVEFVVQDDFRKDIFRLLDPYPDNSQIEKIYKLITALPPRLVAGIANLMPHPSEQKFILFLVDDNLFVRDFDIEDAITALQENPDAIGFSLRLGTNTNYCYVRDRSQALPNFVHLSEHILEYQWRGTEEDFGYPFEVSSSIYRLWDFLPLLLGLRFENPNLLEGRLAGQKISFSKVLSTLLCFETSVVFSNPINKVQNISDNRAGVKHYYSSLELAKLFAKGFRIDTEFYDNFIPNSSHQEVEVALKKSEGAYHA